MTVQLRLVDSPEELRESVARFNDDAPTWEYARKLARLTTYWVYDPLDKQFGPGKFVGYAGMSAAAYDSARGGDFEGVRFDGGATHQAIERTLETTFFESDDLAEGLAVWADEVLGQGAFDGIDRASHRFVVLPSPPGVPLRRLREAPERVWAFFANPAVYRIEDALRQRDEDSWVTAGRDIRRGHKAIIWRGLGPDKRRGVVALGEVLTDPQELDDSGNPFWATVPESKLEQRVRLRYVVPDKLPLWLDEHQDVLSKLSVARAKGGTVFNVTEEDWLAVLELAGGWPERNASKSLGETRDKSRLGQPYLDVGEVPSTRPRDPFEVDPDKVDRGNQAHAKTQDHLAAFLRSHAIEPRSPVPGEPEFDVAWEQRGAIYVAEVKSITDANEEKQLRLGLGQVLRYRHLLATGERKVVAVLVAELQPSDPGWVEMCAHLGVVLVWPSALARLLDAGV